MLVGCVFSAPTIDVSMDEFSRISCTKLSHEHLRFRLRKKQKRQSLGALNYALKLLALYGVLVKTIQPLPFMDVFVNGIFCSSEKFGDSFGCYSGLYFVYSALSVLGLIFQMFFSLIFSIMMVDMNPFSRVPFSSPPHSINEMKLLLKFILTIYFAISYTASLQTTFSILLLLYYVVFILQIYNKSPYYNKQTQSFAVVGDISLFWISMCSTVQGIFSNSSSGSSSQEISSFYLFLGIPMISHLFLALLSRRDNKFLQHFPEEIKKPDDMESYALVLIHLIEDRMTRSSLIKLEGVLHMHTQKCKELPENCPCSLLLRTEGKIEYLSSESQNQMTRAQQEEDEKRWYKVLKNMVWEILKKYNKCSKIHLLIAYLDHEKLKLKFKALTEMMTSENFKPSLREKFSMFRYKFLIELDIIDTDMRNEQNKNVDVNGIVHFENQLVIFLKSIERSVNLHFEFWRELLEESPDIEKLQIVGSRITNTIEDAKGCFKTLCSIRQNNIRSLLIFGNFLKEVVNDEMEAQEHLEKAAYVSKSTVVNKQFADNENMKYSENSNTGILTMSANLDTRFYVQNTNNDFSRILGWPKQEVIDQNIKNHIMPKLIQSIHDGLVTHYIDTSIPRAIGYERLITPTNKEGFIVPSILMIKILPNLEDGLQFVGFFKEKDEIYCHPYVRTDNFDEPVIHYLVYKVDSNLQNQTIVGVTQSVYETYGVPTSLINNNSPMSNQFTIDLICPQLIDPKCLEEIQTEKGAIITIDTTIIEQLFLISQESEESPRNENDPEGGAPRKEYAKRAAELFDPTKEPVAEFDDVQSNQSDEGYNINNINEQPKRYKKGEINVWLEEEFVYKDTVIHIIRFVEVKNDDSFDESEEGVDNNVALRRNQQQSQVKQNGSGDGKFGQQVDEQQEIDYENEEAAQRSNMSANSQDYEELRQLKDIKSTISEKTKPKTIKILQRSMIVIGLFLFILTSIDLSYKLSETSEMKEGLSAIYYVYQRHSIMADINYISRNICDYISTSDNTAKEAAGTALKKDLDAKVKLLNDIQFNASKAQMTLEGRKGSSLSAFEVQSKKLLPNGEVKTTTTNFTDSLNVYMAEAGGLANTVLSDFSESLSTSTSITSTKSNFYSVNYNGIYPLRTGSESIATEFYSFYFDEISQFRTIFLIIMIAALVVLALSQLALLPIVFSVQRTNAIVLSFFAIVPVEEIQSFANKCEQFLKVFIEKKQFGVGTSMKSDEHDLHKNSHNTSHAIGATGGNTGTAAAAGQKNTQGLFVIANEDPPNFQQGQQQSFIGGQHSALRGDISFKQNHDDSLNQSYAAMNQSNLAIMHNQQEMGLLSAPAQTTSKLQHGYGEGNISAARPSQQLANALQNQVLSPQKARAIELKAAMEKAEKAKEEEDQKHENEENQRQKILNAKDHKKKYVIIQFLTVTLLIMVYFIVNYVSIESEFQSSAKALLEHTQSTRIRSSLLKYYLDFLQEGLVDLSPILEDGSTTTTLQSSYTNRIQDNDNAVTSSFKMTFPSQFSSYKTNFDNVNYQSLCQYTTAATISSDQQLSCSNIKALANGLSRVVTQIGVNGNSILASTLGYTSGSKKTYSQTILDGTTYGEIEDIMVFVSPTIDAMNVNFVSAFEDFLSFKSTIDKLCFALFIVFIMIIFVFVWIPYLAALIQRIWMTKGVLNMIPIDIILKHEKLRQAFTAGDILSAVK